MKCLYGENPNIACRVFTVGNGDEARYGDSVQNIVEQILWLGAWDYVLSDVRYSKRFGMQCYSAEILIVDRDGVQFKHVETLISQLFIVWRYITDSPLLLAMRGCR